MRSRTLICSWLLLLVSCLSSLASAFGQAITSSTPLHYNQTYNPSGPQMTIQAGSNQTGDFLDFLAPNGSVVCGVQTNGKLSSGCAVTYPGLYTAPVCLDGNGNLTATNCGPDSPPATANAMDDEFDSGTTLNLSKWTWINQNGGTTAISRGWLLTTLSPFNGYLTQGFTQASPATPYEFELKASQPIVSDNATVTAVGLGLYETATTKATYFWFENPLESNNIPSVDGQQWTGNTFGSAVTPLTHSFASYEYLKIVNDGSMVVYYASVDGLSWTLLGTGLDSTLFTTAADKIGIFFLNNGTSGFTTAYGVDFFRELSFSSTSVTDNFTSAADLNNYLPGAGVATQWTISGGSLTNSAAGIAVVMVPNLYLAPAVSAKLTLAAGATWAGASIRVNPSSGARYLAILNPSASQLQLYYCPNWTCSGSQVEEGSAAWTPDHAQHTLLLQAASNVITVSLDGTQQISFTDLAQHLMSGTVSMDTNAGNTTYQQFSYSGQLGQ